MYILQKLHYQLLQIMLSDGVVPLKQQGESTSLYELSMTVSKDNHFVICGIFRCIESRWAKKGIFASKVDAEGNSVKTDIYYYHPEVGDLIRLTSDQSIYLELVKDRINMVPVQHVDSIYINANHQDFKSAIIPMFAGISIFLWLDLFLNMFQ